MYDRTRLNGPRGRVMLALGAAAWLAGCASAPVPAPSEPARPAGPSPSAHPPAAPAPAPAITPPPAAPVALTTAEVPAALRSAQGLLQEGDADAAQDLVLRVLTADAGNALATLILRQIESDPVALLGRESYAYVVRPGESLSSIARDRLRDANLFYALARYNNIRVPRQLAAGQTIRVPGRAPAATAAPAPATPPAPSPAQQPPSAAPAPAPPPPPSPAPAAEPPAPSAADKARRGAELLRQARVAFARQDLCTSVNLYGRVLELDANHPQARTERQRSLDLIERLRKQGGKLDC